MKQSIVLGFYLILLLPLNVCYVYIPWKRREVRSRRRRECIENGSRIHSPHKTEHFRETSVVQIWIKFSAEKKRTQHIVATVKPLVIEGFREWGEGKISGGVGPLMLWRGATAWSIHRATLLATYKNIYQRSRNDSISCLQILYYFLRVGAAAAAICMLNFGEFLCLMFFLF